MRQRLSIIILSSLYDRIHYALMIASAAAATAQPVTMFFTMGALKALKKTNSAGIPGWNTLDKTEQGKTPISKDLEYAGKGIATMEELLGACSEFGVNFYICQTGMKALGLKKTCLRSDLEIAEFGLVSFLKEVEGDNGQIVFV